MSGHRVAVATHQSALAFVESADNALFMEDQSSKRERSSLARYRFTGITAL